MFRTPVVVNVSECERLSFEMTHSASVLLGAVIDYQQLQKNTAA